MASSAAMDFSPGPTRTSAKGARQGTTVANNKGFGRDLATLINFTKVLRDIDETLTPHQIQLLLEIALQPGLTSHDLADRCDISQSSVSRNLMAMGEWHRFGKPGLNLVEKVEDPVERRRQIAFLTPKGRQAVERLLTVLRPGEALHFEAPTSREYLTHSYRNR